MDGAMAGSLSDVYFDGQLQDARANPPELLTPLSSSQIKLPFRRTQLLPRRTSGMGSISVRRKANQVNFGAINLKRNLLAGRQSDNPVRRS